MPKNHDVVSDVYVQQSDSNPNKNYNVSVIYRCSCRGWAMAGKECKHIRRVKDNILSNMKDGEVKEQVKTMFGLNDGGRNFIF